MDNRESQHLHPQPGEYVIEHLPRGTVPPSGADWVALARAPEGLTVVRRSAGTDAASGGRRAAFYSGQTAHGLDLPGMLAAVVNPLAQTAIPVFATSAYHAGLVFVPAERWHEAAGILRRAGQVVHDEVGAPAGLPRSTAAVLPELNAWVFVCRVRSRLKHWCDVQVAGSGHNGRSSLLYVLVS